MHLHEDGKGNPKDEGCGYGCRTEWFSSIDGCVACWQLDSTAMHWACRGGHLDVVKMLQEKGANLNSKDKVSWGVGIMVRQGHYRKNWNRVLISWEKMDELRVFVQGKSEGTWQGYDCVGVSGSQDAVNHYQEVVCRHIVGEAEWLPNFSPVLFSSTHSFTHLLLTNCFNKLLSTPLHVATRTGMAEIVEHLINNGVNIAAGDRVRDPFHGWACIGRNS